MKISKREFKFVGIGVLAGALIVFIANFFISKSADEEISTSTHQEISTSTFTCSMHPQIRQDEPGKCPICGMDLIPLSQKSAKKERDPFVLTMTEEAVALANVKTHKVKSLSSNHDLVLTGKVAINEQIIAVITANYSGRIEKLYIDFTGQSVKEGEKLATLYSPELISAQKELIEAAKFKDANPALYNASREKLRLWKISKSQIDKIEESGEVLTEFDVYADKSGVVITREVSKGDFVNRGSVLFEIADLSKVWVLFDAYESDLPFVKLGQKVTFTTRSIPDETFTSTVSFIDPIISTSTRTAAVRAEVSNKQQLLKPEMFVKGKIKAELSGADESLMIPKTSLLWTGKRSVVYVRVPDAEEPAFEMREITVGAPLGDYYIVKRGLSEGEEIVSNGVFAVDGAAQLSGNYSMMSRASKTTVDVPDKFSKDFSEFLDRYYDLQESLVQSDFDLSKSNAKVLDEKFRAIEMDELSENAHEIWMRHASKLDSNLEKLQFANDIEKQRALFSNISDRIIDVVENLGVEHEQTYVTYCPMAFDDEGAFWLSTSKEINNPYYGDKMLRCGEIKKTIGKSDRVKKSDKPSKHQGHQH